MDYQQDKPVPGRIGAIVTVEGVLTDAPIPLGGKSALADIQDSSSGITVYGSSAALLSSKIRPGDELLVTGKVQVYKGQPEIALASVKDLGPGKIPDVQDVLAGDVAGTKYLGELVRVEGKIRLGKDGEGRPEIIVRDRTGDIPVYAGELFRSAPEISEEVARGGRATIVGIVNYYQSNDKPVQLSYRLIPRGLADLALRPLPPYRMIAVDAALVLLIFVMIYLALHQRNAARAERERTAYLSALIEGSPLAILVTGQTGEVRAINPAFSRMFGYSLEEAIGKQADDLVAYGELHAEGKAITQRRIEGQNVDTVTRRKRKDGSYVDVEIHGVPLNVQGGITGGYAIYQDITERNRAEKALRRSEQRYRNLFDRNLAGLFHTTVDGRILSCNESFARMLGYASREEVLALPRGADEFYPSPAHRKKFLAKLQEKKILTNMEIRLRRKDGSIVWLLENTSLIEDEGDAPTIIEGTLVDITERKQLEEQLRQTQKMEAIGKLAGGIAHDLNNLLTVIKGNSELLLSQFHNNEAPHKNASQIKKASDHAAEMIRQLLAFSRMQVLQPRVLDLNSVIAETATMLPRLLREDIEVVFHRGTSLGRVKADQHQISQIIFNLAANAHDAMPKGGRLNIETANTELDESYARLHPGVQPGRYVMFSVTDTGVGMDAETQTHIFEPFFTTKEPGKGTGLGLATVYGVVKQSGGWIWVYSEPGRGTTVKIYLPRVEESIEQSKMKIVRGAHPRGSETILLVEDQEGIRDLAQEFLGGLGYKVLAARDGEEAIQIAKHYTGEIHLLLTDVVMPKMGGYELAEKLAELRPDVRVAFMSGYAEYAPAGDGEPRGGEFHLQKPFSMESLAHGVRQTLQAEECVTIDAKGS